MFCLVAVSVFICLSLQLKVALAPCIEGLILLDRLCYLKEQVKFQISGPQSKEFCWYRLQNAKFYLLLIVFFEFLV